MGVASAVAVAREGEVCVAVGEEERKEAGASLAFIYVFLVVWPLLSSSKMLGSPCALHVYYAAFPLLRSSWLKKIFVLFLEMSVSTCRVCLILLAKF